MMRKKRIHIYMGTKAHLIGTSVACLNQRIIPSVIPYLKCQAERTNVTNIIQNNILSSTDAQQYLLNKVFLVFDYFAHIF